MESELAIGAIQLLNGCDHDDDDDDGDDDGDGDGDDDVDVDDGDSQNDKSFRSYSDHDDVFYEDVKKISQDPVF